MLQIFFYTVTVPVCLIVFNIFFSCIYLALTAFMSELFPASDHVPLAFISQNLGGFSIRLTQIRRERRESNIPVYLRTY